LFFLSSDRWAASKDDNQEDRVSRPYAVKYRSEGNKPFRRLAS
jgi:hypothetical protein